ncbi:protein NUCLEAR FUSION DEFECTIVE 4-like [Canna indica]|uniref:Protein NUCLEAR FUSION DEFECTIVE 4-like n=1 Tax=Canna indica TaxID=4628 RepID=A0AAQ3JZT9_9LILI|nr:protein NUCLEAR FUSION DEFECTIVE 4-like [Canna indica]
MSALDPIRLAVHVSHGRWFTLFASFLIMAASGATYIFSAYSEAIKSSLGYDQHTLNTISFFKDLGANVGVLPGLVNEVAPPSAVLATGAAMNLFGYLMIYLAITGHTARPHLWQMCLYICVGANSQAFANTGALVACVRNFPDSRGAVLGLLKGFVGLSGAIFTQLYLAFYGGGDPKSLVLLVAWLPAAVSLVFLRTIRYLNPPPHRHQSHEFKVLCTFLYTTIALAGFLMAMIILQRRSVFTQGAYTTSSVVVLFLLLLPVAIVVREEASDWNRGKPPVIKDGLPSEFSKSIDRTPPTVTPKKGSTPRSSSLASIFTPPKRGEDYSILQAVVSVDMLIIIVTTICGVGGTLTAIDNMGQIGKSLGYNAESVGTLVSLISIWNYAGRAAAGFVSEILLVKYRLPRPLLLALVFLLSCVGHLLIAFGGVPGSLYIASVVTGFCFGAQVPLFFAIISELFGLKHYSTLHNFGGAASPIGSYILNVKVTGQLYDREAARQIANGGTLSSSSSSPECVGTECFRVSFIIITAVTVVGTAVMLVLVWRTWDFYRGDIYGRCRVQREGKKELGEKDEEMVAILEDRDRID